MSCPRCWQPAHLSGWIEAAVAEAPNYILATRLLGEVGLGAEERRRIDASVADHIAVVGNLARRAAAHLSEQRARELAATMINVALAPALTGIEREPDTLRRELGALLRGHGVVLLCNAAHEESVVVSWWPTLRVTLSGCSNRRRAISQESRTTLALSSSTRSRLPTNAVDQSRQSDAIRGRERRLYQRPWWAQTRSQQLSSGSRD